MNILAGMRHIHFRRATRNCLQKGILSADSQNKLQDPSRTGSSLLSRLQLQIIFNIKLRQKLQAKGKNYFFLFCIKLKHNFAYAKEKEKAYEMLRKTLKCS